MRRLVISCVVVMVAVLASGCYHVQVETGLEASTTTIKRPWAPSFIGGLVPPAVVETASKCKRGVASVSSQLSFLNMIAAIATASIYTPMEIIVTCSTGRALEANSGGTVQVGDDLSAAITKAAEMSLESGRPILLQFKD